ncbi:MAG: DUF637 domain-containing protein [Alphaproteobacteria bacterium]|nr:DUF637 domain-containing protein [Alphaproteobacteria bacterium]
MLKLFRPQMLLINNKGNILGALEDMGSSANLKQLAISVVSAEISQAAVNQFGLTQAAGTSLVDKLNYNITTSAINNTVSNVVNGNGLTHGLGNVLLGSVSTSLGEQATQYVGALWELGYVDPVSHLVLHGAIGCATGVGLGGKCGAGALGAVIGEGVGDAAHQAGFTLDQSATIGQFSALGVAFLSGGDASSIQISNATALQAINFNLLLSKSTFAGEFLDEVGKNFSEGKELTGNLIAKNTPKSIKEAYGMFADGAEYTIGSGDLGLRLMFGDEQIDALYTYVGAKKDAAGNWLYDQFTPNQLEAVRMFASTYGPRFILDGTKGAKGIIGTLVNAESSLELGSESISAGTKIYRVYGENNIPLGQSWTTVDPAGIIDYRNLAGLPDLNTGRFVLEGTITDSTGITIRQALPLDGNVGGLSELLIPNAETQIKIDGVFGVNPKF